MYECVHIIGGMDHFYMVFMYSYCFPLSDEYISQLKKIHRALYGAKILVGMDANAGSPLWNGDSTDQRSAELEKFSAESSWFALNEGDNPYTFTITNGVSNIDVTIFSPNLYSWVRN